MLRIKPPKTESGIRDIRLGDAVIRELAISKGHYIEKKLKYGPGFQDMNFVVSQPDGAPFSPDAMKRKWSRFLKKNELPKIRLHDLRHSNATALIQAGVNPRVVQQRLGHSDVNITLNTYTHVLPEMDIEAAARLDSLLLNEA